MPETEQQRPRPTLEDPEARYKMRELPKAKMEGGSEAMRKRYDELNPEPERPGDEGRRAED
ncbi:MAG: hypothetical protein ACRD68_08425 [Pyrinomonadaceae bacterium]